MKIRRAPIENPLVLSMTRENFRVVISRRNDLPQRLLLLIQAAIEYYLNGIARHLLATTKEVEELSEKFPHFFLDEKVYIFKLEVIKGAPGTEDKTFLSFEEIYIPQVSNMETTYQLSV